MSRAALEFTALFILPFVFYGLYRLVRPAPEKADGTKHPIYLWLTMLGLVAGIAGIIVFAAQRDRAAGVYVPAHLENGKFVPGRFE